MDLTHPIRAVVPSLDGPVLEVLAGTTRPLTTLEIHRLGAVGSANGIRLVLERLAREGLAVTDHRRNAVYYTGNRDHLAWPAVEILAALRRSLRERLTEMVVGWSIAPRHASLFGSAARGEGDSASDIDVLLVQPELEDDEPWEAQVDDLRARVQALTGNRCQTFVLTDRRVAEHVRAGDPLVSAWLRDGVLLFGEPLSAIIAPLPSETRR